MVPDFLKDYISEDLISSSMVGKLLGVSRQRVQQMVASRILPPYYVFNKDSKRNLYAFDKKVVNKFLNPDTRKMVQWVEPKESELLSVPELVKAIGCTSMWIYDATMKRKIVPELVIGSDNESEKLLCLYNKEKVKEAYKHRKDPKKTGPRESTKILMDKIKELHAKGLNDSDIAKETGSLQPLINKLRNGLNLKPNRTRSERV